MSRQKSAHPTMQDIARVAGISLSTVDRVLNGRSNVRAQTVKRIQDAAEALGYHAIGVLQARTRSVRPRRTLGFLLQRPETVFYKELTRHLTRATETSPEIQGRAVVEYVLSQSPEVVAEGILSLGTHADAIAVVVADHPLVSEAIELLRQKGVAVYALISDLSSPDRAGYAGMDNRRLGRTAAWMLTELAHQPGKLVMYVGSPRFHCQEISEIAFRTFLREHAPAFEVLPTISTLENDQYGEEMTHDLLQQHPDLCGFYVGGSGIEGVLRAMRARRSTDRIIGVGNELTSLTRSGLISGHFHAILSHPLEQLCAELVAQMVEELAEPSGVLRQIVVPLEIWTPQNV